MPKEQTPKYPIDLGKTMKDMGGPISVESDSKNEIFYPSLHLEWEKPYGFPDEGTMTVRFKKTSQEDRKTKDGTRQTVNLDVLEILDTEASKGADAEEEDSGDILDKEVKKIQKKKKKSVEVTVEPVEEEESY